MTSLLRRLAVVGALACALLPVTGGPASAAEPPCWKLLMLDYYDGAIDNVYPIACYTQAIANLRDDERIYTGAEDELRRAQQRAIAIANGSGGGETTTAPDLQPSSGDDSVPVPLIVLGGVAVLLVAVGAGGVVRRRMRDDGSGTA